MSLVRCPMCYGDGYYCDLKNENVPCHNCNGTGRIPKKKSKVYEKHYGTKDEKYFKRRQLMAKLNLIERLRDWISYRRFLKETY